MERFKVTIGDWSQDGHNMYDEFVFQANKTVEELQQGYKNSCVLTGVQFNHNVDYTQRDPSLRRPGNDVHQIFCDYEESTISRRNLKALEDAGLDFQKYCENDIAKNWRGDKCYCGVTPEKMVYLILDFIKLSISDLEYEEAFYKFSELKRIPPLNGWWNKELNHQFGYGLYGG